MSISSTRLVFLATGKYSSSNRYTQFSLSDLQKMPHATGFVIFITDNYSVYGAGSYDDLITDVMNQISVVAQTKKPYYVSIPAVQFGNSYNNRSKDYNRLKTTYILPVWEKIKAHSTYKNLFKGFHFRNERVFGSTSATSPTSNAQIGLMNDLAYVIRNDPNTNMYKEFIWTPYLGYNSTYYEINTNIGNIVNRTNIFNTVFLQTNYFFTPSKGSWNSNTQTGIIEQTLDLAVKSVTDNKFYNFASKGDFSNCSVVSGSKTSSTKVALVMEAQDELKSAQATYSPYYKKACEVLGTPLTNSDCPFVFYAGSYNGIILRGLCKTIDSFYADGSYMLP